MNITGDWNTFDMKIFCQISNLKIFWATPTFVFIDIFLPSYWWIHFQCSVTARKSLIVWPLLFIFLTSWDIRPTLIFYGGLIARLKRLLGRCAQEFYRWNFFFINQPQEFRLLCHARINAHNLFLQIFHSQFPAFGRAFDK